MAAHDASQPHGGQGAAKEPAARKGGKQIDFDLEFFDRVLARSPSYVDVLRCQGELLSHKGQHERALEIDRRLAELRPDDCIVRYNLACSLANCQHKREAIAELRRALEQGYDDFEYLACDRDLDALRDEPGYQQLLRDFRLDN